MRQSFLTPIVRGGRVGVRISGVICRFDPDDPEFEGWGIFKPISLNTVKLQKRAGPTLVRQYLDRLTPVELIVADSTGRTRGCVVAHPAGSPVKVEGMVPVHLVSRVDLFRHVTARFDGFNFWFERVCPGRNPAAAAYLRQSLNAGLDTADLHFPGLTPREKTVYAHLRERERGRQEDLEKTDHQESPGTWRGRSRLLSSGQKHLYRPFSSRR